MGRRRPVDQPFPLRTRTRTGCLTCRARKVKCDERKPVCQRCCDARKTCEFGTLGNELKWEAEYASKGLAFGRAGLWTKSNNLGGPSTPLNLERQVVQWCDLPPISPYHFVNHDNKTFDEPLSLAGHQTRAWQALRPRGTAFSSAIDNADIDDLDSSDSELVEHSRMSLTRSRSLPLLPELEDPDHSILLNYYVQKLCPLTTLSKLSESPFASLVLPFTIMNSTTGILSILALSACHRAKHEPAWKAPAMKLKAQVLRALQNRFQVEGPEKVAASADTLVTMVILCLYEIISDCDSNWVVHLRGAHDIIRFRQELQDDAKLDVEVNDLTSFAEKFFAFQDIMGRTACGQVPLFGRDYWSFGESVIDVWMGCSSELVALLCTITELSRAALADPTISTSTSFCNSCHLTRFRLEGLIQTVENPEDGLLVMSAEIKRLAALLYLNCALYNALPTTPLVVNLVEQILRLLCKFLERGFVTGLTWPVFVAAVELDPSNDQIWIDEDTGSAVYGRPLVLKAFNAMETSTVSNTDRTRAIITQVWQARDSEDDPFPVPENSLYSRNDWERYVALISGNISLV